MVEFKMMKFKKIGNLFKKLPRILAEKSFLTFLGMFFLVLFLGLIVLFYYGFSSHDSVVVIDKHGLLKPDTEKQEEILKVWQRMNKKFMEAENKKYPDPFQADRKEETIEPPEDVTDQPADGTL